MTTWSRPRYCYDRITRFPLWQDLCLFNTPRLLCLCRNTGNWFIFCEITVPLKFEFLQVLQLTPIYQITNPQSLPNSAVMVVGSVHSLKLKTSVQDQQCHGFRESY
eukprot:m.54931 g.54931  ORF g.54931 m.54931 type:complete len:106 (+) comp9226_c0_seq1:1063-1380(+)